MVQCDKLNKNMSTAPVRVSFILRHGNNHFVWLFPCLSFLGVDEKMAKIDVLLRKARAKVRNIVLVFLPLVVPDTKTADQVQADLDEFCGDRLYSAIIISGEEELEDDVNVRIDCMGGD